MFSGRTIRYHMRKSMSIMTSPYDSLKPEVSVIIPVHNGAKWIDDCLQGILSQNILSSAVTLEVSVYDDSSTDDTQDLLAKWQHELKEKSSIEMLVSKGQGKPRGVGFAKNQAVKQSTGRFLCFQDVDDVMLPSRLSLQLQKAKQNPEAIVGSKFMRDPPESTVRFTRWANHISHDKLSLQVYTSHGPTIVMPTWFCSRNVYDRVGGFSEAGQGTPEDLIFFYKHLDLGGAVCRVDEVLLMYRYHENATTFSILEETIWRIRIERIISKELQEWSHFTIWNAGKQGRRFYRSLPPAMQEKVVAMCDVDSNKLGRTYKPYYPEDQNKSRASRPIPIISYQLAKPPFVICIKLDLTAGNFEENLASLNLTEGKDYVIFS